MGFMPPGMPDALGVHTNHVRRAIRSFADARHADIVNERLPQFRPPNAHGAQPPLPLVPAPSMRLPRLAASAEDGGTNPGDIESAFRSALEAEGLDDDGVLERLAERIVAGRIKRPKGLRRFESAP